MVIFPARDGLIKNARDQRAGDLAAGITALTQPDRQQIYHVIPGLRDRRNRPVTQHRADMRAENSRHRTGNNPASVPGDSLGTHRTLCLS